MKTSRSVEERLSALEKLGTNHPKLIHRAFAVWGNYLFAQLIIVGGLLLVVFIFGFFTR